MTRRVVDTGLPALAQPFSWAVAANGTLYTAHGPVRADGSIDGGAIAAQTRLTLQNLETAVRAAGATLADVVQVLVYLKRIADIGTVDTVYREFFAPPYPNRSAVGGLEFAHPAMAIEIVAYVALG